MFEHPIGLRSGIEKTPQSDQITISAAVKLPTRFRARMGNSMPEIYRNQS
jgi:hypothetical protein